MNQDYVDTVRLLLAIAPLVFKPSHFALKGGTALNLFVQERLLLDSERTAIRSPIMLGGLFVGDSLISPRGHMRGSSSA